ncbi:general stress protein [Actinopolyspora sp. H202]|uniref:General stress protein 17M-like domain-containing protein n=1 Tax=Actinopolyspora mzabensis TaxID=995066 RepID=A0A1G8VYU9_ACTMZ|nr:general stress protein [Actinopolyspora mzabensis]SDJ71017.1 hypothetical protein SAMN04487820_101409 [Actinopolyspora mzabensis]
MSSLFPGSARSAPGLPSLPTPPTGWPIGSYGTYEEAQRAVDHLADNDFPVQEVTIVGVDLMLVERVTGRLNWARVLGSGALSGGWFGLFIGLVISILTVQNPWFGPVLVVLAAGIVFGMVSAAITYASMRGRRDFSSSSQVVAGRYDVLSQPSHAEQARDMLARLAMGGQASQQ